MRYETLIEICRDRCTLVHEQIRQIDPSVVVLQNSGHMPGENGEPKDHSTGKPEGCNALQDEGGQLPSKKKEKKKKTSLSNLR